MRILFLVLFTNTTLLAQLPLASLPEPVTNNAVTQARVGDSLYIYSFAGLDETKIWSGIHLKAWRLRWGDTAWQVIPAIPDPMGGKIAAAASAVKEKIYLIGGSGVIIGDTLYYAGGARTGSNFPATSFFRKGYIHPDDPSQIDWTGAIETLAKGYRMACVELLGQAVWLGGSEVTYNYNAIAYDGSGGVPALGRITVYQPATGTLAPYSDGEISPMMDFRGVAKLTGLVPTAIVLAGGMGPNQQVRSDVWLYGLNHLVPVNSPSAETSFRLFPNPATKAFTLQTSIWVQADLFDLTGKKQASKSGSGALHFETAHLPAGLYFLKINPKDGPLRTTKIVFMQ